jgi:hypothetical protein
MDPPQALADIGKLAVEGPRLAERTKGKVRAEAVGLGERA